MIVYTVTDETKAAVVAALAAHGSDCLALAGLGRIAKEDSALATGAIVAVWPADADGMYRIALNDAAGMIVWRAYMCAEIAAGRGKRRNVGRYCDALGVEARTAHAYVVAAVKGTGMRPLAGDSWSEIRCGLHATATSRIRAGVGRARRGGDVRTLTKRSPRSASQCAASRRGSRSRRACSTSPCR
jgi:hypothetical protein